MKTTRKINDENIKILLEKLPNSSFDLKEVHSNQKFSGVAVVTNNKLAKRIEDIKFVESLEPNTRHQFLKEGKVLSALKNENIPRTYDLIEQEDFILIRSEHIEGYSLREVIDEFNKRNEKIPKKTANSIALKLAKALYYTHNEVVFEGKKTSIVHCDIKPENIILSAKSTKEYKRKKKIDQEFLELVKKDLVEPFLIDFGIFAISGRKTNLSGTLEYLSKEQIENKKITWKTDMYQLILTYLDIVDGKNPYFGLSRKKIIELKKSNNILLPKESVVSKPIKEFIYKSITEGDKSLKSEKEYLKEFSKIVSKEKKIEWIKKYKKQIISYSLILLILFAIYPSYLFWDAKTQSTDAILMRIEKNQNPTLNELKDALHKLQARSFEKKYHEPLMRGEFKDKKTKKLLYPSHLNVDGSWVFVGPDDEAAGAFVGLLFDQSEKCPEILKNAKEYAEPILNLEYDGSNPNNYIHSLIPAYEKTNDTKYLIKLINVSDQWIDGFEKNEGVTQTFNLYTINLILWVYEKTNNTRYLYFSKKFMDKFIQNNIELDGYIYDYSNVNVTSPYGPVPDSKGGSISKKINSELTVGRFVTTLEINLSQFKESVSPTSKDFIECLFVLKKMHELTKDVIYLDKLNKTRTYYFSKNPNDLADKLFVLSEDETQIPTDTLPTIKLIEFFQSEKNTDEQTLRQKIKIILKKNNFKKEFENGIIANTVILNGQTYNPADETLKRQTTPVTDKLFLKLK